MNREEEILGEIEKLDCELSYRRKLKADWEWLNENRQSLFERYATGFNAKIAFYEKEVFSVGVFSDKFNSQIVEIKWDNDWESAPVGAYDGGPSINIMDLLRRKTDSPSKILKGYKPSMTEIPEWVDKD